MSELTSEKAFAGEGNTRFITRKYGDNLLVQATWVIVVSLVALAIAQNLIQ